MIDIPIIFSAPMVRALLDGRKTMTRRLAWRAMQERAVSEDELAALERRGWQAIDGDEQMTTLAKPSAWQKVRPGDRLWVRENFVGARGYDEMPPGKFGNKPIWYAADGEPDNAGWFFLSDRTRPAIHMPRWASRLTLTVTAARVEPLSAITEEDARAEGVTMDDDPFWRPMPGDPDSGGNPSHLNSFEFLWNVLHGPEAWDANPDVVALTFSVAQKNIDAAEGTP